MLEAVVTLPVDEHAAKEMTANTKEALNKSQHASCLHIFRLIARKLLEIHQVFLRHFHTINRKICLRNLHTRFNQRFLSITPADIDLRGDFV